MFTPSLVFAYWMRGSIAQPFYDIAPGLGGLRRHPTNRARRTASEPLSGTQTERLLYSPSACSVY